MNDNDNKKQNQQSSDQVAIEGSIFPVSRFTITSGPMLINPDYKHRDVQHCSAPLFFDLTGDEYLPARQIAAIFVIPYDALRKRLERLRNSPCEGVIHVKDPQQKQPKYLYQLRAVLPEIEAIQCGKNVHRKINVKEFRRKQTE